MNLELRTTNLELSMGLMMSDNRTTTLYVVAYDISSDKWRTKIHKILSGFGHWTQFSFFECFLSENLKYTLMVPTYGILKPLVWGLDKLGYAEGIFKAYQEKLAEKFAAEKSFEGYEPTENDVFVCAYVKSGTNWTLQMAHEIAIGATVNLSIYMM